MITETDTQVQFLHEVLGDSPSLVADNLDGQRLVDLEPEALDHLLLAHVLGPVQGSLPARAKNQSGLPWSGRLMPEMLLARPVDRLGRVWFGLVGVRTRGGDEALGPLADLLNRHSLPCNIVRYGGERRFGLWFILDRPGLPGVFATWLNNLGDSIGSLPSIEACRVTPVADPGTLIMMPYSWKLAQEGGRGRLLHFESGRLRPLHPADVPRITLPTQNGFQEPEEESLALVLHAWHERLGSVPARAGAIVRSVPTDLLRHLGAGHSRSIRLGMVLRRVSGRRIGRYRVKSQAAGHSTKFSISVEE